MSNKKIGFNEFESQNLISAISNPTRTEMLKVLSRSEPLTFTELLKELNLDQSQTGKFSYHLRALKESNIIIESPDGRYSITDLGKKIVDFLWEIEDISRQAKSDFYVRRSKGEFENFDRTRIKDSLITEAEMPKGLADKIAKEAEGRLIKLNIEYLTSSLIREFVNAILLEKGYEEYRHSLTRLGLPIYDVSQLINESSNSNYPNPDYLIFKAGKSVFNQYLLQKILSWEISDAHIKGYINIPNLSEWIFKPLTINHDLNVLLSRTQDSENITKPDLINILENIYLVIENFSAHILEDQILDNFNNYLAPMAKDISDDSIIKILKYFFEKYNSIESKQKLTIYLDPEILPLNIRNNIKIKGYIYETKDYENETQKLFNLFLRTLTEISSKISPNINLVIRINEEDLEQNQDVIYNLIRNSKLYKNLFFLNKNQSIDGKTAIYNTLGFKCNIKWKRGWKDSINRTGILDYINLNLIRIADESINLKSFEENLEHYLNLAHSALSIKYKQINERLRKNNLLPLLNKKVGNESYYKIENSINEISIFGFKFALKKMYSKGILNSDSLNNLDLLRALNNMINNFHDISGLRWALTLTPLNHSIRRLSSLEELKTNYDEYYINSILPKITFNDIVNYGFSSDQIKMIKDLNNYLNGGYLYTFKLENEYNKELTIDSVRKILNSKLQFFNFS